MDVVATGADDEALLLDLLNGRLHTEVAALLDRTISDE
jgi:hypothetical protein